MLSLAPAWVRRSGQLAIVLLFLLAAGERRVWTQMDEYSVKAGYLYNFSKYVTWPEGAFSAPTAHFMICILGDDPFGNRLDLAIAGKISGNGKSLEVKRLSTLDRVALKTCQVLFLSKSEKDRSDEVVDMLRELPIFTVADFDSFAEKGGIADMRIDGARVKVDLNVNAANRANLKVSARLQQVANLVP